MADFASIRDGIKANLSTISGLTVWDVAPESIAGHTIIITPADDGVFIEYGSSMDGDSDDMAFVLHLYVPRRDEKAAQDALDAYLARTGASSILAAASSATVAGTQFAEVMTARDYGGYTWAGNPGEPFLGCKFDVVVGVG